MRLLLALAVLLSSSAAAQDYRNWDSLGRLKTGDKIRVTLDKQPHVNADFRSFTANELQPEAWSPANPTSLRSSVTANAVGAGENDRLYLRRSVSAAVSPLARQLGVVRATTLSVSRAALAG